MLIKSLVKKIEKSEYSDGTVQKISTVIIDEKTKEKKEIYFSVDSEYEEYIVTEVLDAFVLASILPAIVSEQDIIVEGNLSDYFWYHSKTLIYLMSKIYGHPLIRIRCSNIVHNEYNPQHVGTACSGGVDSLTTFINHFGNTVPDEFTITQLALFNVGSYGNNHEKSLRIFKEDIKRAEKFARHVNLPLVKIDSNISEIYTSDEIFHFSGRDLLCIGSAIILLKKLWKVYFISAESPIDQTVIDKNGHQEQYEPLLMQLLSDNNLNVISAEPDFSRVKKTEFLSKNEIAQKFLYVCAKDIWNINHKKNITHTSKPNCSECSKCAMTMLTLDYLGELGSFSDRFDLDRYKKIKSYLERTYYIKRDNVLQEDIVKLMKSKGYKPSIVEIVARYFYKLKFLKRIMGKIYHVKLRIFNPETYSMIHYKK